MPGAPMISRALTLLLLCLIPVRALAQDDAPIAYPDQDQEEEDLRRPRRSEGMGQIPQSEDDGRSLANLDDPSKGFAAELLGALVLLEASRGGGVDAHFGWGARLTWEAGRLFSQDLIHEGLFLDFTWMYTAQTDGTTQVSAGANYHYFTLAPAFGLPFGSGSPVAFYATLGGGVTYEYGVLATPGAETTVAGVKPTFLYGVGIRGRPLTSEALGLRLVFRVELTRFRRAYMDDTYIGASMGAGF